ncbi:MAG: collagen-like protein [Flavobacteriaceae bacterium]
MNKINTLIGIFLVAFLLSCEGPDGPPGVDGLDGVNILGQVVDIEGTFSVDNDYSIFFEFPQTIEVFESDIVLVYLLFDQVEDANGGDPIDIWRLLPQTRILDQGLLQYNYEHTFLDVNVFLESDFDLSTLLPGDTDNQVFRIAVVPADFGSTSKVDTSNMTNVMAALGVSENEVGKIDLN